MDRGTGASIAQALAEARGSEHAHNTRKRVRTSRTNVSVLLALGLMFISTV